MLKYLPEFQKVSEKANKKQPPSTRPRDIKPCIVAKPTTISAGQLSLWGRRPLWHFAGDAITRLLPELAVSPGRVISKGAFPSKADFTQFLQGSVIFHPFDVFRIPCLREGQASLLPGEVAAGLPYALCVWAQDLHF